MDNNIEAKSIKSGGGCYRTTIGTRLIADYFGKRHDHILRDIKKISELGLDDVFFNEHFIKDTYTDSSGRQCVCYKLTQIGFIFLSMNFSSSNLMQLKSKIINYFHRHHTKQPSIRQSFTIDSDMLICRAIDLARDDLPNSLKLINEAFLGSELYWAEYCTQELAVRNYLLSRHSERDVYDWFRSNFKNYVDDSWNIVKRKSNPKHIPDFWLSNGIDFIPVECKLHEFDIHALHQLERYMQYYHCEGGLAVASSLKVELPGAIKFIKFDFSQTVKSNNMQCDAKYFHDQKKIA